VLAACRVGNFDVVLDHSGYFFRHAAQIDTHVLATLHLPRSLYPAEVFHNTAKNLYFNCVSESQRAEFKDLPRMMPVVRNGIDVRRFAVGRQLRTWRLKPRKRRVCRLLWRGRCIRSNGTRNTGSGK
jgi:hypothetical protein